MIVRAPISLPNGLRKPGDPLNTGSSRSHWSSVRSLGYGIPRTVTTRTVRAIGANPVAPRPVSELLVQQPGVDVVEESTDGGRGRDQWVGADLLHIVGQRFELVRDGVEGLPGGVLPR